MCAFDRFSVPFLVPAEGFIDDLLEWNVFFYGESAAVVEFRCGVLDAAIDARQLDAHVAESCGDAYMFARQDATMRRGGANAEGCRLRKNQRCKRVGVLRLAQHREQRSGP